MVVAVASIAAAALADFATFAFAEASLAQSVFQLQAAADFQLPRAFLPLAVGYFPQAVQKQAQLLASPFPQAGQLRSLARAGLFQELR